jgi:hypothetical protein
MNRCERFEKLIEEYLAGDIAPADLQTLRQHSEACPECRRLMEIHSEMHQIAEGVPQPSEGRFAEMRAAVLGCVRSSGRREVALPLWRRWAHVPALRLAPSVALAIVFLIAGVFLGRLATERPGFDEDVFVEEVLRQASLEKGLGGYWDSPFIYSNVSFRPQADGTVTLDFDVTRHMSVTRTVASPLTREILVHAMIDPAAMGTRLTAMGVARESMDEKLTEALIFILLNDPSLPVRLRSLEILTQYASDPVVQDALLASLSQDPSVQIRLLALESLAGEQVGPGVIRQALGETLDSNDRAVLHRAAELMSES